MRGFVQRAAMVALLAAPVWAASGGAASAGTAPASSGTSCSLVRGFLYPEGSVEALIGNLSPAAGSTVAPGSTIGFLIADKWPFHIPLARDVVVTVNGASVTVVAGAEESGVPITYVNPRDKKLGSTDCEVPFSFALPSTISGSAHICATAYGGNGSKETVSWTLTVQATELPGGALGGLGLAAIGGVALMAIQVRRRRGVNPRTAGRDR